jgi:pimeloyl-ACP methyl ester carboxylesterase
MIEDCVYDIDGVVEYLKNLGYERFFLMGKSTGANKICVYHDILQKQRRESPFAGYILFSGGDDVGLWYEDMGAELFQEVLSNAKKAVDENRGEERPTIRRCFLEDFSYQSAYDILNPDGSYNCFPFYEAFTQRLGQGKLFEAFSTLDIPTLVLYGAQDEYVRFPMKEVIALLKSHNTSAEYDLIPGANHSFDGHEKILAMRILSWIKN